MLALVVAPQPYKMLKMEAESSVMLCINKFLGRSIRSHPCELNTSSIQKIQKQILK